MDRPIKRFDFIETYLDGIFAEDLHAKRVKSLANGTFGVMTGASMRNWWMPPSHVLMSASRL